MTLGPFADGPLAEHDRPGAVDTRGRRTTARPRFVPCAVVPTFDNPGTITGVVDALLARGLPVVVVDDASHAPARDRIDALRDRARVVRRRSNGGKGAAVKDGLQAALDAGFTHALQVDADGQHDLDHLDELLDAARAQPDTLVLGAPVYDETAPSNRKAMRKLSIFWVHAATLFEGRPIVDPMCGFRVYPLRSAVPLAWRCGDRMDFDPEVAVRLAWAGPVVNVPVRVRYFDASEGGVSHFRAVHDNALISRLFGKLIMLRYSGAWRVI